MQDLRYEGKRAQARFFCSALPPIGLRTARAVEDEAALAFRMPLSGIASFPGPLGAYDWERRGGVFARSRHLAAIVVTAGFADALLMFLA